MAHGISINVGVLQPCPDCCVKRTLKGCEIDAMVMAELARGAGFEVVPPLLGAAGTWANVEAELTWAAGRLVAGDIALLSFSGHGCQVQDDGCEEDLCEALCFADQMVPDHKIEEVMEAFAEGVRILVVCDSCHSGGAVPLRHRATRRDAAAAGSNEYSVAPRFSRPADRVPPAQTALGIPAEALAHFRPSKRLIRASVLLLAAAEEPQPSRDGERGGLFTTVVRHVWNGGQYPGNNYKAFIEEVADLVMADYSEQHPTWAWTGVFPAWMRTEKPFTV